jgi:putative hydrolase of the HAD superfamily
MLPPHVRAVFFDAVGTLIHPAVPAPRKYADAAARAGLTLTEGEVRARFVAVFRDEEKRDREASWVTSEEREVARWRHVVARTLAGAADPDALFRELYDHYAEPEAWAVDPVATRVFAELRGRGLVLGLASNYDRRLEAVVDGHAELRGLLPNVVISSRVGHRKPGGAFFAAVLGTVNGLSPDEIAFVGDDVENDYAGATAAGMLAILLDPQGRHPNIANRVAALDELLRPESP